MNWLKRTLGIGAPPQAPAPTATPVPTAASAPAARPEADPWPDTPAAAQALRHLEERLQALDVLDPGLGARAMACYRRPPGAELRSVLQELGRHQKWVLRSPARESRISFRDAVLARPVLRPVDYALYGAMVQSELGGAEMPGPSEGLRWFMRLVHEIDDRGGSHAPVGVRGWRAEELAAVLEAVGVAPERLVELAAVRRHGLAYQLAPLPGLREFVLAHPGPVLDVLRAGTPEDQEAAAELLTRLEVPLDGFRDEVLDLALGSRRTVRAAFQPLLQELDPTWLRASLEARASRPADERARVAEVLWSRYGDGARPFLEAWRGREKAERIQRLLSDLLQPVALPVPDGPPEVDSDLDGPLSPAIHGELRRLVELVDASLAADPATSSLRMGEEGFRQLLERVEGHSEAHAASSPLYPHPIGTVLHAHVRKEQGLLTHPELLPAQLVRLVGAVSGFATARTSYWYADPRGNLAWLGSVLAGRPDADLGTLSSALALSGLDADLVLDSLVWGGPKALGDFPPERAAAYLAARSARFEMALLGTYPETPAYARQRIQSHALQTLVLQASVPPSLQRAVFELGLLGLDPERGLARSLARPFPDLEGRLVRELTATVQARRTGAATWLAALGAVQALEPLRRAAHKEGNEACRAAMLSGIEQLGGSVDEFVGRDALQREAVAGLARGFPAELEWAADLPAPTWREDGMSLSQPSLHWLLVRAHRLKTPEPDPLLQRYARLLGGPDGRRLGADLLKRWLQQAEDPHEPAPSRGLLALVAVFAGPEVVDSVAEFIVCWYGQKATQIKALLEMLSWMEHGEAIQLLLGVADRFQTPGIQEAARQYAQGAARRRGWSAEQLGDRTCPTAGFDAQGILRLDYGARWFEARLDDRLGVALADSSGAWLKTIPKARKDDDASRAASARKTLIQARKKLEEIVDAQTTRLASCMAQGRTWSADEWSSVLLLHPILRRIAIRALWRILRPDGSRVVVRPLEDASLTDVQDDEVRLGPEDRLELVHETLLKPEESAAWLQHLEDYRLEPLFPQLDRHRVHAGADQMLLDDFRGHLIDPRRLHDRAARQGFSRGPSQGSSWFCEYVREYAELGLRAELGFSGWYAAPPYLPPDAAPLVALHGLAFRQREGFQQIPLREIPAPLLSESWHQIEQIAAAGTGFQSDWETRV